MHMVELGPPAGPCHRSQLCPPISGNQICTFPGNSAGMIRVVRCTTRALSSSSPPGRWQIDPSARGAEDRKTRWADHDLDAMVFRRG
jgi:hypothetical protein